MGQSAPTPSGGAGVEVGRVEPGGVPGVVDHRAADAAAGVVGPQRHRVGAADLPRLGPVQGVGAAFVADPVGVRVPERPGVQADDAPAGAGQPLGEDAAAGAGADDHQVDLVVGRRSGACRRAAGGRCGSRRWAAARRIRCGPGCPRRSSRQRPPSVAVAARAGEVGVRVPGPFDAGGEGHRVGVDRGRRSPTARGR